MTKKPTLTKSAATALFVALLLSVASHSAFGDYLVQQATIKIVTNTGGNQKNFVVQVSGGTGPCSGRWMVFPEILAADVNAHQRAYATALLAFTTGALVSIYNYTDNACDRASYIHVEK